jgi:hypothetical protein
MSIYTCNESKNFQYSAVLILTLLLKVALMNLSESQNSMLLISIFFYVGNFAVIAYTPSVPKYLHLWTFTYYI